MYRPVYGSDQQTQAAQLLQQRQQLLSQQQPPQQQNQTQITSQQPQPQQQFNLQQQQQQQQFRPAQLQPSQQLQNGSSANILLQKNANMMQQPQAAQQLQQNAVLQTWLKNGSPVVASTGLSPLPQQTQQSTSSVNRALSDEKVYQWIIELVYGSAASREQALLELGKKRELYDDLALALWHSFGVMTSLLGEIIAVYPLLSPPQLGALASNRVCNALLLLQCVASHSETRNAFLSAYIPLFLYPFLSTTSKQRPFEYLRLTSLGVIGALVKNDTPEVISFLLTTEIIPLCLRIMESSSELSKTVAIFIVQKILVDDAGLNHVCATFDRFNAVNNVLQSMVEQLVQQQTVRLLKHVVRCYLRLSDNADARKALRKTLPEPLKDATFSMALRDDNATKRCLAQLLVNISEPN